MIDKKAPTVKNTVRVVRQASCARGPRRDRPAMVSMARAGGASPRVLE